MTITYVFSPGQRVYIAGEGLYGEVTSCVPGNGSIPWYWVRTDDGEMDRYTAEQLQEEY
jgi:hypothetical protein